MEKAKIAHGGEGVGVGVFLCMKFDTTHFFQDRAKGGQSDPG